ncbi:MAG: chloride channel protein [Paracoccaceae bacterium]
MFRVAGDIFRDFSARLRDQCVAGWRTLLRKGPGQIQFWLIALLIGIAAGGAALGFRIAIAQIQEFIYGADDVRLASYAERIHWSVILATPIIGGLLVGLLLHYFTPDHRARSVAHVIEGAALGDGRMEGRAGLASALASLVTLSTGGSTGREGPVVHLAAVISSGVSRLIRADGVTARDLMGCAVAAAVSASFNAPIAGAIFALEVVLRHFAVHAFAPIVIASVAGTVVSRTQIGNVTEFILPVDSLEFYVELPAFLILGLLSGVVAVVMMRSIFLAEDIGDRLQDATGMPPWLRPAVAGALLGAIAIAFPHIIGVGYETTSKALTSSLPFRIAVLYAAVKVIAVSITFAGRMGGGVFSPSLMLGALTGLSFGWIATGIFPAVSGTEALYALAGMGAVAAAVLGAPISTILIVFEMTGDWQAGIAVMVSVSLATALSSRLVDRSFFLTQIERSGTHVAAGPQEYLPATIRVGRLMRAPGAEDGASETLCRELVDRGVMLESDDTLETALPIFERSRLDAVPVVERAGGSDAIRIIGALFHVDALIAYNRALAECAREEHS